MTRSATPWILLLCALASGCSWFRGATIPIWFDEHPAPSGDARGLVVLLPGIGDDADDFVGHGFVERIHAVDPSLDVIAVEAHLGYYVRSLLAERVHQDIIRPRRSRYQHVSVVGISLGGLGAITYAAQYPHVVDRVVVLAPFLGDEDVVQLVREAGGVRHWVAPELEPGRDPMKRLAYDAWTWARTLTETAGERPQVFLGYGQEDLFASAHAMFAQALPAERVLAVPGDHTWSVWQPLFDQLAPRALR